VLFLALNVRYFHVFDAVLLFITVNNIVDLILSFTVEQKTVEQKTVEQKTQLNEFTVSICRKKKT
jgi:hypothetical protein